MSPSCGCEAKHRVNAHRQFVIAIIRVADETETAPSNLVGSSESRAFANDAGLDFRGFPL
jgi:hypothetical protein